MTTSTRQIHLCASSPAKPQSIWAKLGAMLAISHQRRRLSDLDDHMLNDIGITQGQAAQERRKTAWDIPDHWRG